MKPAHLRPVPEAAPRALGLVRVSKEREVMISPEVQHVAISDYTAARGYDLVPWSVVEDAPNGMLQGIDESGSRAKSAWWRRLEQAVAAVEAGEYDVIVVWKFSRTARHRLRWAVAIDRVETAGGRIESATEQFDTTTSAGRFARGMLGELNAFEAERIGETWKEAHEKRVRSGRPHSGKPKWGYAYDPVQKLHVPDPETGPVLADMYRRFAAGESFYTLARWLNAHGHRTMVGGTWRDVALRRVLDAGFGAGRFMARGELHAGIHEAVITETEWQAYLDQRASGRRTPARTTRSPYVLSGLVRCARCGGSIVASGAKGHDGSPTYRCQNAKQQGPEVCVGGYTTARLLEDRVLRWLAKRAGQIDARTEEAAAAGEQRVTRRNEAERLAREVGRNEEALARLVVQNAERPLPASVYDRARGELEAEGRRLREALEDAQRAERAVVVDPSAAAAELLEGWDEMPVEIRRAGLRDLIRKVEVWTRRPESLVKIYGSWELQDDPTYFERALAVLEEYDL